MTEKFSLKDHLFNESKVRQLARELAHADNAFDEKGFVIEVMSRLLKLELKARISWIRACLHKHLPDSYKKAVQTIVKALPPQLDHSQTDDDFGDFIYAPYNDYVATYGCKKEHLDISFCTLHELTRRFSAEDAIRYFINAFPDETFEKLEQWAQDQNYHVRRLCSEGTRHRLPWCVSIQTHYSRPLPLLDILQADKTRYVTRSVANHLNDISKVDPELVIKTLKRWRSEKKQTPAERDYICTHALRTLVKQGNPEALTLLGYDPKADVKLHNLQIKNSHSEPAELRDPTVKLDTYLEFSFSLISNTDTPAVVDYIIIFAGVDSKPAGRKVFKLKNVALKKDEELHLLKRHHMRSHMTTRTLYPGLHTLQIQVNGQIRAKIDFGLIR